jgi:hypothetical protein
MLTGFVLCLCLAGDAKAAAPEKGQAPAKGQAATKGQAGKPVKSIREVTPVQAKVVREGRIRWKRPRIVITD